MAWNYEVSCVNLVKPAYNLIRKGLEVLIPYLQVDPSTSHGFGLSIGTGVMLVWHRVYPSLYKEPFVVVVGDTCIDH